MAESTQRNSTLLLMLDQAITLLKQGIPVAFPTETVYGLGAPIFCPSAIEKVFALKRRPSDNPLIIHISRLEQLDEIVETYPPLLAARFWPGPLTLLLPKKPSILSLITAGLPNVCVRMPSHPLALALIDAVGPLAAPSANLSGRPSSTTAAHVREDFGQKLFVLDGGTCEEGLESTVLSFHPPMILRPGTITQEALEEALGEKILLAEGNREKPLCPGMKYKHYAPKAKVILIQEGEMIHPSPKKWVIENLKPKELYTSLRAADQQGFEEIYIRCTATLLSNSALMNRLKRAAHQ